MLKYFINYTSVEQVNKIYLMLDPETKKRIECCDYSDCFREYNACNNLFDEMLELAKQIGNEQLARYTYHFRTMLLLCFAVI